MTKSQLKQLIREVVTNLDYSDSKIKAAVDKQVSNYDSEKKSSNINAQKLVGKTIKSINVNPTTGVVEIAFTDGKNFIFGEADGIYGFEEYK
jgi:predicted Zn-dependent protease